MSAGDSGGPLTPVGSEDPLPDPSRAVVGGDGPRVKISILAGRVGVWAFLYVVAAITFTWVRNRWLLLAVVAVLGVVTAARGLHEAGHDALDEPRGTDERNVVTRGVRWLPGIGLVVGVLLGAVGITLDYDGLVFFGVTAVYMAIALWIDVLRDSSFPPATPDDRDDTAGTGPDRASGNRSMLGSKTVEWRRWLVGIGVLVLAVGVLLYALLDGDLLWPALVALGLGALLVGVGLTLISEPKLRRLCAHGFLGVWKVPIGGAGRVAVTGVVLYCAGLVVFWWLVDMQPLVLVVGLTLLTIMLALVARSNSDVMIVLAMAALIWALTQQPVPTNEAQNLRDGNRVVVAIGDSWISGEGSIAYFEGTNDPRGDPRGEACRRSPTAYPNLLMEEEVFDLPRKLLFLACSGDTAFELVDEADEEGGQLYEAARMIDDKHLTVDFVLLSIGGNDALFGNVGPTCVRPGDCSDIGDGWIENVTDDEDGVAARLDDAYEAVRQAVGDGVPVLVVPYPIPLSGDDGCDYAPLTGDERDFLVEFGQHLDDVIEQRAIRAGFYFVDTVEQAFAGHKLCEKDVSPSEAAANLFAANSVTGTVEQSVNPTNWFHNSLHPNPFGHTLIRASVLEWIADHPDFRTTTPGGVGAPVPPAAEIEDQIEESGDAAEEQGGAARCVAERGSELEACTERWARQQTAFWVAIGGIALGLTAVGAWLLSLAAIHWWRRLFNPNWCQATSDRPIGDASPSGPMPNSALERMHEPSR